MSVLFFNYTHLFVFIIQQNQLKPKNSKLGTLLNHLFNFQNNSFILTK